MNYTCALAPLLALVVASPAVAQESLPFLHDFGTTTTSGCGPSWESDCEVGLTGFGDDDSLTTVTHSVDGDAHGVMVVPGDTAMNGVGVTLDVSSLATSDPLRIGMHAVVLEGTADLGIRVVFKNSSGGTISTQTKGFADVDGLPQIMANFSLPTGSDTAVVSVGASDPSSAATRVILGLNNDPNGPQEQGGGCHGNFNAASVYGCPTCAANSPGCNISCPSGSTLIESCIASACKLIVQCYCDNGTGLDAQGTAIRTTGRLERPSLFLIGAAEHQHHGGVA